MLRIYKKCFMDLCMLLTSTGSHSSYLLLYTGPTTFSLLMGSSGFTNGCHSVLVSLKYVGIPYLPNTRLRCSENPFMHGITTGIFFYLSLLVFSLFLLMLPLLLIHCCYIHSSPLRSIPGSHFISSLLLGEWRQTGLGEGGLVIIISHNAPSNILWMTELKMLTGFGKNTYNLICYIWNMQVYKDCITIKTAWHNAGIRHYKPVKC